MTCFFKVIQVLPLSKCKSFECLKNPNTFATKYQKYLQSSTSSWFYQYLNQIQSSFFSSLVENPSQIVFFFSSFRKLKRKLATFRFEQWSWGFRLQSLPSLMSKMTTIEFCDEHDWFITLIWRKIFVLLINLLSIQWSNTCRWMRFNNLNFSSHNKTS